MLKLVHPRLQRFQLLAGELGHVGLRGWVLGDLPQAMRSSSADEKRLDRRHERIELGELLGELDEGLLIRCPSRAGSCKVSQRLTRRLSLSFGMDVMESFSAVAGDAGQPRQPNGAKV